MVRMHEGATWENVGILHAVRIPKAKEPAESTILAWVWLERDPLHLTTLCQESSQRRCYLSGIS